MGDGELSRQARRVRIEIALLVKLSATKARRLVLSTLDRSRDWLVVPVGDVVHLVPGFVLDPGEYGDGRWIVPGDRVAHDVGPEGCWCVPATDEGVVTHNAVSLAYR